MNNVCFPPKTDISGTATNRHIAPQVGIPTSIVNVTCHDMTEYRGITMPANSTATSENEGANRPQVLVWDPLVRIGHWLLVLLFFVAYFTEDDWLTLHSWAGYGIAIFIVVRIIWGFLGTLHARFSDFACGPARAAHYLKDLMLFRAKRYIGHSPAGGLMIFAILFSLAATTVTGIALLAVEENTGPMAPWLGRETAQEQTAQDPSLFSAPIRGSEKEGDRDENHENNDEHESEILEEVHEFFSNLTLVLIVIHVGGVVLASVAHKENLVRAMVTGRKRPA